MFSLYKLANLVIDNSYGRDILRGVVSRPKSGPVGGWVGMVHPDSSQKLGWVGIAFPDWHHFRGKLGNVKDNPDSGQLLSLKSGELGYPDFPEFRLKSRVKSGFCRFIPTFVSKIRGNWPKTSGKLLGRPIRSNPIRFIPPMPYWQTRIATDCTISNIVFKYSITGLLARKNVMGQFWRFWPNMNRLVRWGVKIIKEEFNIRICCF